LLVNSQPQDALARSVKAGEAILNSYPYIESGDIDEALQYAAFLAEDETVDLRPSVPAK
jgi:uncharacterized protein (DUF433 family)